MASNSNKIRPILYIVAGVLITVMFIVKMMNEKADLDKMDYMQIVVGPLAIILAIFMLMKKDK